MHFTVEAQRILGDRIAPGDIVIDATAGNGHDTVFLADRVGEKGLVYAIDIQASAIEQVRLRLQERELLTRVKLHIADHKCIKQIVAPGHHGAVKCVVFNLGYLPFGDKSITTTRESSIAAIDGAASLLKTNGWMTILAYVGHPGGREEAQAVQDWLEAHADTFAYQDLRDPDNPASPILWVVEKR
ncbi:MAG: methyltransferase domain-containing protein [Pirellula sp.]|jgi:predicted methyltransferase|nr:methyltransferase domain-containing protein [Pirellula sp.]